MITSGELVFKAQNIFSMKERTTWFWDQHHQQQLMTVPTHTVLRPKLDVTAITDIHDIPKIVCKMTQAKKAISGHSICLTDFDYDYILKEIYCLENIYFKIYVEVLSNNKGNLYDHFK